MTHFILEDVDAPGSYYVQDFPPVRLDARHMIRRTTDKREAARFGSMIAVVGCALSLPGKWKEIPVSVNLATGEVN